MEKYADWQDAAAETEAEQREDAIAEIRRQVIERGERFFAHCQWCGEETSGGAMFCCPECGQDAERAEKAKQRNRRIVQ